MLPFLEIKESVVSAFDNIRELSLFLSKSDSEKIEAVSSILKRTSFKRLNSEDVAKISEHAKLLDNPEAADMALQNIVGIILDNSISQLNIFAMSMKVKMLLKDKVDRALALSLHNNQDEKIVKVHNFLINIDSLRETHKDIIGLAELKIENRLKELFPKYQPNVVCDTLLWYILPSAFMLGSVKDILNSSENKLTFNKTMMKKRTVKEYVVSINYSELDPATVGFPHFMLSDKERELITKPYDFSQYNAIINDTKLPIVPNDVRPSVIDIKNRTESLVFDLQYPRTGLGNISLDKFVWKEYIDGIPRESEQNSTTTYKNFIDEFKMAYTDLVKYYSRFSANIDDEYILTLLTELKDKILSDGEISISEIDMCEILFLNHIAVLSMLDERITFILDNYMLSAGYSRFVADIFIPIFSATVFQPFLTDEARLKLESSPRL